MDFFDKLGATITSKSKDVAQKTKDFAEINNLNGQINSQNKIIQDAYIEIGYSYFEEHREDENDKYVDMIKRIKAAQAVIGEKKLRIREIKGVHDCEACGAELTKDASFCPKCGKKVEAPEPKAEEAEAAEAEQVTAEAAKTTEAEQVTAEAAKTTEAEQVTAEAAETAEENRNL